MANVGAYFFKEYYKVLLYQPNQIHHFYSDNSTMIRVDRISSETASGKQQIDALLKSVKFVEIEIKTINSTYSWDGGVLAMASGLVKIKDLKAKRKFVQGVFLAPQENGYYVLSDMFQFTYDGVTYPIAGSVASEKNDTQPHGSATLAEPLALSHSLEEEASECVKPAHIEDDPVDKYSLPEQQQPHASATLAEPPALVYSLEEGASKCAKSAHVEDDTPPHASATALAEPPALDYNLEEEASACVKSAHVNDDPVDKSSLPEQQQPLQQDLETGVRLDPSVEEASSSAISSDTSHEHHVALVEELLEEEPPQKTYAYVLQSPRPPNSRINHAARRAVRQASSASGFDYSGFERVPTPPGYEEAALYSYGRGTRKGNVRGKRY